MMISVATTSLGGVARAAATAAGADVDARARPDTPAPQAAAGEVPAAQARQDAPAPAAAPPAPDRLDFLELLRRLDPAAATGADSADGAHGRTPSTAADDADGDHAHDKDSGASTPLAAIPTLLANLMTLPAVQAALASQACPAADAVTGTATAVAARRATQGANTAPADATAQADGAGTSGTVPLAGDVPSMADAAAPGRAPTPRSHAADIDLAAALDSSDSTDAARTSAASSAPAPSAPAWLAAANLAAAMPGTPAAAGGALALRGSDPAQWRPALREALGDSLKVQVGDRSERAVIRLDPPSLGRIEIVIRHEAGNLQVHLSASNADVLRQLQTLGDSLRQDLVHRQYGEVAVTVSDTGRDDGGQGQQREGQGEDDTPGRALAEAGGTSDTGAFAHLQDRK
jgi:flagellar hook-length control protein FliK